MAPLLPLALDRVTLEIGGTRIVSDFTLKLGAGTRTVIVGPNGAGKSMLLRLCHGLIAPTGGTIAWAGDPAGRQAMVFQRPAMLRRSVLANVAYGLKLRGVGRDERERRARDTLARVGLADIAARPARVLSGGEQQRVALARAWALAPEILFLDEPTASLDPPAAQAVESIVLAMAAEGTKVVMTTHNLGQARRIGDEIVFVHKGRIAERAAADAFFRAPATPEAAAFLKGELPW
ncbi:MAG: ATP-binding cassette domain-containing protein [Rhodospirillales bacterium]|nr:ATP-binding cassette domain-containing protein [Rhodospirillales bacterium]